MKLTGISFYTLSCRGGLTPEEWSLIGRDRDLRDMMRYDGAFMREGSNVVAFPSWRTREGKLNGEPTLRRWSSHGFQLERLHEVNAVHESFVNHPREWVTYRHPSDGRFESTDFAALAPVTAKRFFDASPSRWREMVDPGICQKALKNDHGKHIYSPFAPGDPDACVRCGERKVVLHG